MKKIKLNLSQLTVNSFETSRIKTKQGTVKGNVPETEGGDCLTKHLDTCVFCSELICTNNCPSFDC